MKHRRTSCSPPEAELSDQVDTEGANRLAVYSSFFVASPESLLSGFPGWKLPLPEPVRREITDFFGEKRMIETREPNWDDEPDTEPEPEFVVTSMEGDYEKYLEARLPGFVRKSPHWCSKGLTNVELDPLGEVTDGEPALVDALFAHPSCNALIFTFREAVVERMRSSPQAVASKWAAQMSTPEFTHSVDGDTRVQDDWTVEDALSILTPLVELAHRAGAGQRLYLLLEW